MKLARYFKTLLLACVLAVSVCGLAACGGANGGTAATINGNAISENEVTETIQTVRTQSGLDSNDAWGQFLVANQMTPETVREQIINSLVEQQLVKEGAKELNISVDSTEVDTYVESMKANFDSDDAWKQALEQAGFTEQEYRESIENSLMQQQLVSHFEEQAKVEDADILESAKTYAPYYDGAKRSSHILIGVDDVNDEAAMADARKKAADLKARIDSGAISFEDAAKENSTDTGSAANGGDVGWDVTSSFATEYQQALSNLEEGQVSDPVDSPYGVHIIKVTQVFKAPEEITSLDQLPEDFRTTVQDMAKSVKANSDYSAWLEGLKEKANIVINPMPSNVPYNIDLKKYQDAAAAATSGEAASTESGSASGEASASGDAAASTSDAAASASSASTDASASSASASSQSAAS